MRFEFAIAAAIIVVVAVTTIAVLPLGVLESSMQMDIPGSTNMRYDVTVTCSGTGGHINAQLQWISEPPHPHTYKTFPPQELSMWLHSSEPVTDEFTVHSGETYLFFVVRDYMPEATGIISWDGTWRCYFEPAYHNVSGYDNIKIYSVEP